MRRSSRTRAWPGFEFILAGACREVLEEVGVSAFLPKEMEMKTLMPIPNAAALLLVLAVAPLAPAQRNAARRPRREIQVYVDGSRVQFDRVRPILVGRRVLVPLRGVFEKMGAKVAYDAVNDRVFAKRGGTSVTLSLHRRAAYVNGQPRRLDTWPKISRGHVLVPIRFIAETLDAGVVYSAPDHSVRIHPH